jgi:hypothetical protein
MAPIVGSTPNRRPTRPPSCGGLPTGRSAAVGHLPIDGISRMTAVVASAASEVITSTYLSGAAFAHSRSRARATDRPLPTWGWARPGMTGLLGTGPRAMPLRAAPGRSSGPQRVPTQPSTTRSRCSRHPLPAYGRACQLGNDGCHAQGVSSCVASGVAAQLGCPPWRRALS